MTEITKEALRDQATKVYIETMDKADKDYLKTIRQARDKANKDYWEVQGQAEKVYQETIAPKQGAGPRPSMNREFDGRTWEEMP